jgi:RNA-directed DNA polymerase
MSTEINRLSELAKEDPKRRFFSIAHLITPERMYAAFLRLRKDASAGVDGVSYEEYEKDAARNIRELHRRLKDGKYRAQPLRRVYIPKENGKQRPISIPALEDKLVQKVVVEILNAIYEQDFLDCSYGFRPGRGAHQALDQVGRVVCTRPTGWILEIDITAYFDTIVREQLMVAAKLVGVLADERSAREACPVVPVVISGGGAGDQTVESPEVKVPVGKVKTESAPTGGRTS